jgi:hypothetical protein
MKKMNGINIDKWRVLNKTLFDAYIRTYYILENEPSLSAPDILVNTFAEHGILDSLTRDSYGSAYTIARELGVYYEEEDRYVLSKMSKSYLDGQLSYQDLIKYYCLNIEFLINNEVVHPFSEIIEALNGNKLNKSEIAQRCVKLVPHNSPDSVIECLRLFLHRCVEAELIVLNNGIYQLNFSYNLLKGSLNKSKFSSIEFEELFISGDQKNAQKNVVNYLIERKIRILFENSLKLIAHNKKVEIINPKSFSFGNLETQTFTDIINSEEVGLYVLPQLTSRFTASLLTKPFVILTGLSGSGKTKLAQAFVTWISASPSQFKIIPVGADWTNREPLLGYPNGLEEKKYSAPDSGSLQLLIEASKEENKNKPYFLILDEMNLSHVERYFADFLSVMESQDKIRLYSGKNRFITEAGKDDVPQEIGWPKNIFIIGTVNIDETTYMFSPKVLDRANVIEFRISKTEMGEFLGKPSKPDLSKLLVDGKEENGGLGQNMADDFMKMAKEKDISADAFLTKELGEFFTELQKAGAEFGYRSASEILLLMQNLEKIRVKKESEDDPDKYRDEHFDIAIMQKLLPKLHGSRNKLVKVLETLAGLCLDKEEKRKSVKTEYLEPFSKNEKTEADFAEDEIRYKISFLKLCRMYKAAMENGYASYAEA